ncbi:MAG TPA: hypothetical protein H9824_02415 [Candidatus Bacteroides pullicola]|uniref:Uncharacterized protein n=1 Tax=Candidatus Bacteroides pullicola TaxID=2838475 RepID=A0A9D1ZGZ1_9BACE|nr:hypothetical protein [Candidatus Bacteroides pullicola]
MADTLFFVYESEEGFGQRILQRATIDKKNRRIVIGPEIGKRDGGYYVSYMPYPFVGADGKMHVVSQDDGGIYNLVHDSVLVRTKTGLFSAKVPMPMSQYAQDVYAISPNKYVLIGREPKGGSQYVLSVDMTVTKMDTIHQIRISPTLTAWMANVGKMVYSGKYNRMAFAYRLHPIVEIFDTYGKLVKSVRIGEDTFNPVTLNEADFEELNTLHTVDVTYTPNYIYALHWSCKYDETQTASPTLYKIDWNGKIVNQYVCRFTPLYGIAALNDSHLVGWTGTEFVMLILR